MNRISPVQLKRCELTWEVSSEQWESKCEMQDCEVWVKQHGVWPWPCLTSAWPSAERSRSVEALPVGCFWFVVCYDAFDVDSVEKRWLALVFAYNTILVSFNRKISFFLNSLTNRARWGSNEIASALSYRALWHGKREWEIAIDSSPHTLLFARDTNVLCGRQNESWSRDLDLKKHEQKKSLEAHSTNIDCGGDFTHHLPRVSLEALAREGFAAGQPEDLLRENHESWSQSRIRD